MKDLIRNIIREYISEGLIRSDKPSEERYEIIANKVIEFMDHFGAKSIPDYRFLQDWKPEKDDTYRPNLKYDLEKFLVQGEYDNFVKPLIQKKRPEFSFTTGRGKRHRVDDFVVVYSNGEKIVYNTFKMNGIKLTPQPKKYEFEYQFKGQPKIKKPDFYWPEKNTLIEVAGLEDQTYNTNYKQKMDAAKKQAEKMGMKMIVLDYFTYRKSLQKFYKYVCEKFGFPYDPMDFWTANISQGLDQNELRREAEELVKKGADKTYGERWRTNKIITQLLSKKPSTDFYEKPEGYESVWDFKRDTGIGMRWSDPELRKQVQQAWCQSSGSNQKTYDKFKELFKDIPMSKTTVENIKNKFPEEFNIQNKNKICKN